MTTFSISRPRLVVLAWLLITLGLAAFALQLPHDVKAGGFNNDHGAATVGQRVNETAFHDPANEVAVVVTAPRRITPEELHKVEQSARTIPGVASTVDASTRPQLGSKDGRTQVVVVGFRSDNTATQNQVSPMRSSLQRATNGTGLKTSVTGGPALDYDLNMQSSDDAMSAEMIAFPLLIIVVLVVYRAIAPTLMTLTVAGMSLSLTQALGDLLARHFSISNMYITGSSLIGLAVSVDYCLFVLKRHQEFVADGLEPKEAIAAATKTAGHAVRFGGTAVIAALCALFIPQNMVFTSIAASGIIVTLLAIALTSTFLPALVSLLGTRTFWGKLPGFTATMDAGSASRAGRVAFRAPALVTAGLIAVFVALAVPMATLVLQVPVASASILPEKADSRVGIEAMKAGVDSRNLFPTTVTIESPTLDEALRSTQSVTTRAGAQPGVSSVLSSAVPSAGGHAVRTAVDSTGTFSLNHVPLVTKHGNDYVSRVMVTAKGSPDSAAAHDMVRDLRSIADDVPGRTHVAGATAQGTDFDDLVEDSIPWILLSVAVMSVVLLGFAFRSFWLPLIAIALNALVVAGAMGTLTLGWRAVTGDSLNSVTPIVMLAIIFGLSMDYMVLMANRMKEEFVRTGSHRDAIRVGSQRTARLVTSAAIIMMAVFISFLVAEISIVRELGVGLAIAVFFDAFIVRTLLMPAALALMGERVWGREAKQAAKRREDAEPLQVSAEVVTAT